MEKEKLLISSCLLGEFVKYNGHHNLLEDSIIEELKKRYTLFSVCPETEGGLPTPRFPNEIISINPLKVINKEQVDQTKEFVTGATKTLEICKNEGISKAILKANSPSCGNKTIYDGTFSSRRIKGSGVTADMLIKNNIEVYNEDELEKLIF